MVRGLDGLEGEMEALVNTVRSSDTHHTFIHQKGIVSIESLTMGSTCQNESCRIHFLGVQSSS